ncbi:MAG: NAD(+) synthase [Pseudomonadota bacterium]|nr:NAD(+) synthase [Pseudomonadota bacterium]
MPSDIAFHNLYCHDLIRAAVAVPRVHLADPAANAAETVRLLQDARSQGACLVVFPELGLTGYSCEDLFHQEVLLDAALQALQTVVEASSAIDAVAIVGLPLRRDDQLYNVAAVVHQGRVLGLVPKSYLPNYREFYEARQFTPARAAATGELPLEPWGVLPWGTDLLFRCDGDARFTFAVELCEDLWVPVPPSSLAALRGAQVLVNLSASPASLGKAGYRRDLVAQQSARCLAAYLFSAAGFGESTTDLAWDGHALICENGSCLAESERYAPGGQLLLADLDIGKLSQERMRQNTFAENAQAVAANPAYRTVGVTLHAPVLGRLDLLRPRSRYPYVPSLLAEREERCREVLAIQVQGLARRLEASGLRRLVLGVSGGLDSTLGLIVATLALQRLGLDREHLLAYTLPGFATSTRTRDQAWRLMRALGCSASEIDIRPACLQMLRDIAHPYAKGEKRYDVTFENVQAGARTSLLFRLANQHGALVVGTSDLSELALGWSTYGVGDHMAHYHVNASVPKTLVRHLIEWSADSGIWNPDFSTALIDVVATEISPELVPGDSDDQPAQSTEDVLGPYALHDFFLYGLLRHGYAPAKLAFLAAQSWCRPGPAGRDDAPGQAEQENGEYSFAEVRACLGTFLRRFFVGSQFKRSCIANAPKVGSGGSLSPRGDWRAPSDAEATVWLAAHAALPES